MQDRRLQWRCQTQQLLPAQPAAGLWSKGLGMLWEPARLLAQVQFLTK
jgi:hypothetical protein